MPVRRATALAGPAMTALKKMIRPKTPTPLRCHELGKHDVVRILRRSGRQVGELLKAWPRILPR
jgi:hypothetical protein